jgi:hypothetical protein
MNEGRTAATAAQRVGTGVGRVLRAWRVLPGERRQAALAATALFVTLFLPWYQETIIANGKTLRRTSASLTGWGAFSFVEAAVLLVAAGVLTLLFQRAEGRAFHLPGGDGGVIAFAGFWTCVLIVWRIFDKQGTSGTGVYAATSGIEWGIFIALAVAAFLAYSGNRIRAAHLPEPPLPGEKRRGARPPRRRHSVDLGDEELEVRADQPDHQDPDEYQGPGFDDVAEHADHEADHQQAREQRQMGVRRG